MTRSKDKRDAYYRRAKESGYRARSAFKLIQLDEEFGLFAGVHRVLDLCAAPGGWSQVAAERLAQVSAGGLSDCRIIAVDLQEIAPIEGVTRVQGDITHPAVLQHIEALVAPEQVELVLSDGAPDVTGMHDMDEYVQHELVRAALTVCGALLKAGGTLVAKIFRGPEVALLYAQLRSLFGEVYVAKPRASRNSSTEAFVVCRQFGPRGVPARDAFALPPFVACGDLNDSNADMNYVSDPGDSYRVVVQPPIDPPYQEAIRRRSGRATEAGGE